MNDPLSRPVVRLVGGHKDFKGASTGAPGKTSVSKGGIARVARQVLGKTEFIVAALHKAIAQILFGPI